MMEDLIEFIGVIWLLFMAGGVMLLTAAWMWKALLNIDWKEKNDDTR